MSKLSFIVFTLLLLSGESFAAEVRERVGAEDSSEKIEDQAAEVILHVQFFNSSGRRVTDLREEEIRVLVDGEQQTVSRLIGPKEPIHIGLLMDVSPSKEKAVDPIRQATGNFLLSFLPQNPVLLLTFDSEVYVDCDWTTDWKKVEEALWEFGLHKPGAVTILREALGMALTQKFFLHKPRTIMILFSDGVDTGSKSKTKKESLSALKGYGIVTHCVQHFSFVFHRKTWGTPTQFPESTGPIPRTPGPEIGPVILGGGRGETDLAEYKVKRLHENAVQYLGGVARATGGVHIQLASVSELGKAFDKIAEELVDVYTISFVPWKENQDRRFHPVHILTTREGVIARFRPKGYWAVH
jgi:VWFA-related protein